MGFVLPFGLMVSSLAPKAFAQDTIAACDLVPIVVEIYLDTDTDGSVSTGTNVTDIVTQAFKTGDYEVCPPESKYCHIQPELFCSNIIFYSMLTEHLHFLTHLIFPSQPCTGSMLLRSMEATRDVSRNEVCILVLRMLSVSQMKMESSTRNLQSFGMQPQWSVWILGTPFKTGRCGPGVDTPWTSTN